MSKSSFLMAMTAVMLMASPAIHAKKTQDGAQPAEESVCDVLRDGDYTKGLYGLCVAYCEAEARSDRVLANYDRKRREGDPEMPCLATAQPECPCWTAEMVAASAEQVPMVCDLGIADGSGGRDEVAFLDFAVWDFERYRVDSDGCNYIYDPNFNDSQAASIDLSLDFGDPGEELVCRADLLSLCGL